MNDDRLLSRLTIVDDLGDPDPAFLDRMYDAVAAEIGFNSRPRRRLLRASGVTADPRRLASLAAAVVLAIVGFAALSLYGRPAGVGGPSGSASPTQSPSPSPSASPAAWWHSDVCGACAGVLPAGTHTSISMQPRLIYTVPAGWVNNYDRADGFQLLPDTAANRSLVENGSQTPFYLTLLRNVRVAVADCTNSTETGAGFTADELVSTLSRRPGINAGTPVPVTVGGLTGKQIDLAVASGWTTTCPESNGLPAVPTVANGEAHWWAVLGERKRLIVLDDPQGGNIFIEVAGPTDGFDGHLAASMAIVETFEFGGLP